MAAKKRHNAAMPLRSVLSLDFYAAESGFKNGMGGASNAAGASDLQYVVYGKDGNGV